MESIFESVGAVDLFALVFLALSFILGLIKGFTWQIIRIATILAEESELTQILYNHAMGLDEDFDEKIRQFYSALVSRTEGAIKLGQDMGLIRKSINPSLAAHHLVGSVKEVMYHRACGGWSDMSTEKMVEELIGYAMAGILSSPSMPKKKKSRPRKSKK